MLVSEVKRLDLQGEYISARNIAAIVKESKALINKEYLQLEIKKAEEKYKKDIEKLTNQLKEIENKEPEEKILRSGYVKFV